MNYVAAEAKKRQKQIELIEAKKQAEQQEKAEQLRLQKLQHDKKL